MFYLKCDSGKYSGIIVKKKTGFNVQCHADSGIVIGISIVKVFFRNLSSPGKNHGQILRQHLCSLLAGTELGALGLVVSCVRLHHVM